VPAPTLIQYAETTWTGTGAKNITGVAWNAGDLIVVIAGTEVGTSAAAAPTNANLSFAPGTAIGADSTHCWANTWTATAASSQTAQTIANAGILNEWGMAVWVFRGSGGAGVRATDVTTALTVSLARGGANSLVVFGGFDFNAVATTGYSFTPTVAHDRQHLQDGSFYSIYVADFGDQGGAGTTSYGIAGVTTGTFSKIALEIKGLPDIPPSRTAWQAVVQSMVPWLQKDRRNALLVATAANPLVSPLDTAWQADARYNHLYSDTAARDRRAYFTQRAYASPPGLLTTALLENELLGAADTWRHLAAAMFTDRREVPQQPPRVSDPSLMAPLVTLDEPLLGQAGLTRKTLAAGYWDRRLVPQQRPYVSDPLLLGPALLENELLGGAQTPRTYQTPGTHAARWWMPQQPARPADPLLIGTALLENELLGGGGTAGRYLLPATHYDRREVSWQPARYPDPLLLGPAAPLDPVLSAWLPRWIAAAIAATHADRREMPGQRAYVSDPSFYPTVGPADPLTLAWGASGGYWHLYNRAAWYDRREVPQQRAYVSDPLLLATALLENELLGSADTARRYLMSGTHTDRREVPQQRAYISDPSSYPALQFDPATVAWGAGGTYWHLYNRAAELYDRRLVPQQRPYVSDPGLLLTALLEPPFLGGATTGHRAGVPASHADRRLVPAQPRRMSAPGFLLAGPSDPLQANIAGQRITAWLPVFWPGRRPGAPPPPLVMPAPVLFARGAIRYAVAIGGLPATGSSAGGALRSGTAVQGSTPGGTAAAGRIQDTAGENPAIAEDAYGQTYPAVYGGDTADPLPIGKATTGGPA